MSIICCSINHKRAPVRILETLTLKNLNKSLFLLKGIAGVEECSILQTCHRIEIYLYVSEIITDELKNFFKEKTSNNHSFDKYADFYMNEDAISHLFKVASGLESVILGENEILHQVIECYKLAKSTGSSGPILDLLFESAVQTGSKVRKETNINKGSVSIGNLVLKAAHMKLNSLNNRTFAIIGAGKIGCIIAKAVSTENVKSIIIANRTFERAKKLAEMLCGVAVNFDRLEEVLAKSDVVICATASPHQILTKERVLSALTKRIKSEDGNKGLFIIDVSNPRGVDPEIKTLSGVDLLDLDNLADMARHNRCKRESAVKHAEKIVEKNVKALLKRLNAKHHEPLISDLMRWADEIRLKNLGKAFREADFSSMQRKTVQDFSYSLMRDLLIPFIEPLRDADCDEHAKVLLKVSKRRDDS